MVAGLACDKSSTSNINLIDGVSEILSPFAKHKIFESSRTVFRFSTQIVSTGPSRMIHFQSTGVPSVAASGGLLSEAVLLSVSPTTSVVTVGIGLGLTASTDETDATRLVV